MALAAGAWFWMDSRPSNTTAAAPSPAVVDSAPTSTKPQAPPSPTPAVKSDAEVMLLLDASGSMLAEDSELDGFGVSRFEVLKRQTAEFINHHPEERIGAVAFAATAYVLSRPTTDHENLLAALDKLKAGKLGTDGTAIGSAIIAGYAQLATEGRRKRVLILLTDGDNNSGFIAPLTAAEIAAEQGVMLLAIGLGRNGVAPFPTIDTFGKKQYTTVKTTVDETGLRRFAEVTAGRYRAAPNAQALADAFHEYEAVKEKCPASAFTAAIPERFASSFGTASVEGGKLVLKGLSQPPAGGAALSKPGANQSSTAAASTAPIPLFKDLSANPGSPPAAATAGPSLTASLSKSTIHLGETAELHIKAHDLPGFRPAKALSVPGLEVKYSSTGQAIEIHDGKTSNGVDYQYSIKPSRTGTFTIPAQTAVLGQTICQSSPVQLVVQAASPAAPSGPTLSASLSSSTTHLGETVELTIKSQELGDFSPPKDIAIDGLKVTYTGNGQSINMRDGKMVRTSEHHYSVQPEREGTFTIPAQAIWIGPKSFQTSPLQLIVKAATPGETVAEVPSFAEIVPASTDAKVGEAVSVEIRLGVDSKIVWQPTSFPVFIPDGFLRGEMPDPKATTTSLNGHQFDLLTFHTTLTPLKSGRFKLGPVTLHYKTRKSPAGGATANLFANTFSSPFANSIEPRTTEAPAITIEVKP